MSGFDVVREFQRELARVTSLDRLAPALREASTALGFNYFALSHHVDFLNAPSRALRIHNYPNSWARRFDDQRLGLCDPVHRASHMTASGFRWRDLSGMIPLSDRDMHVLIDARNEGIGEGFTIPAHVPGEARGSVSFVVDADQQLPAEALFEARAVGDLAFEAARRIGETRPRSAKPRLTDRQLECVLWVARGKTDWEIATILGLSRETVIDHLRHARARYQAATRSLLPLRALFDGSICFSDIFP